MWLADDDFRATVSFAPVRRRIAIGVPARDEAASIAACLAALDAATMTHGAPVTVVVGANNCGDETAAVARAFRPRAAQIVVAEVRLPATSAHAGGARRHVMDRAAALAGPGGVVMTSDADSRVAPDWIVANLAEIAAGADAVAGVIAFDEAARAELPELTNRAGEWRWRGSMPGSRIWSTLARMTLGRAISGPGEPVWR